ncbi:hypothetical protein BKA69DRAFT_1128314 [Paraphysoderma sedebokerense]|nr:hypothetical protein BKA69DRAFT_1128314 [Paraphysoderma sedebokerense]
MAEEPSIRELLLSLQSAVTDIQKNMVTKTEFSTGIEELKAEIGTVKVEVENVKTELGNVKVEVDNVKTELGNVKVEVENVKTGVESVKVEVENFKSDLENKIDVSTQELKSQIGMVYEVFIRRENAKKYGSNFSQKQSLFKTVTE